MEVARLLILFLIAYVSAYSLIDRICKCVECCFIAKNIGEALQDDDIDLDELFQNGDEIND